jgi:hypothetical protein
MQTQFQLYRSIENESVIGYPFIAKSQSSRYYIYLAEKHIDIDTIHEDDLLTTEQDYTPTDRFIQLDMHQLVAIIRTHIGTTDFILRVDFNELKEIKISYHKATANAYNVVYATGDNTIDMNGFLPLLYNMLWKVHQEVFSKNDESIQPLSLKSNSEEQKGNNRESVWW